MYSISRNILYQLFTLKVGLRLTYALRGSVLGSLCKQIYATHVFVTALRGSTVCGLNSGDVLFMCAHVYDVALCGNTVINVALRL